jgi:hypothetical protein
LNFHDTDLKNTEISNFIEIRPVGAELFHADGGRTDGRTDVQANMMKLTGTFSNYANAPKMAANERFRVSRKSEQSLFKARS